MVQLQRSAEIPAGQQSGSQLRGPNGGAAGGKCGRGREPPEALGWKGPGADGGWSSIQMFFWLFLLKP